MKKLIFISIFVPLLFACAGLQQAKEDPLRSALYATRTSWTEIRVYTMQRNLIGQLSDEKLADFRVLDDQFTQAYNIAYQLYLRGKGNTPQFNRSLRSLRNLLLTARQKFYKRKKGDGK